MAGGLMQLVAYGAQDVYLTGNPQITFFKVAYSRYTNFAMEAMEQTFTGQSNGWWGTNNATSTIQRSGDLLGPCWLEVRLPSLPAVPAAEVSAGLSMYTSAGSVPVLFPVGTGQAWWTWVNYIGFRIIKKVTLRIGGQPIDYQYGMFMYLWFELTTPSSKQAGIRKMVGGYPDAEVSVSLHRSALQSKLLQVPLNFFFCTHPGLYLPLIALQYHEVQVVLEVSQFSECVILQGFGGGTPDATDLHYSTLTDSSGATPPLVRDYPMDIHLWSEYVYLDTEERQRFAQNSHEYLIKQVQRVETQFSMCSSSQAVVDLRQLNHPVLTIIWNLTLKNNLDKNDWTNFSNGHTHIPSSGKSIASSSKITTNGQDRIPSLPSGYFRYLVPYRCYTAIPEVEGIYTYSFALDPEQYQPSGTFNFSRIDNSNVVIATGELDKLTNDWGNGYETNPHVDTSGTQLSFSLFAVNYNVLRVMSCMGGLAYAN